MDSSIVPVLLFAGVLVVSFTSALVLLKFCLVQVQPDQALIISGTQTTRVRFGNAVVLPILQRGDIVYTGVHIIPIARTGANGVFTKDSFRVDLKAEVSIRVNRTADDVLKVAQSIGAERTRDLDTLHQLFDVKLTEALKACIKTLSLDEVVGSTLYMKDRWIELVGHDLHGFVLDDIAIERVGPTDIADLDENNILDAQHIRAMRLRQKDADEDFQELRNLENLANGVAEGRDWVGWPTAKLALSSRFSVVLPSKKAGLVTVSRDEIGLLLDTGLMAQPAARIQFDRPFVSRCSVSGDGAEGVLSLELSQEGDGYKTSMGVGASVGGLNRELRQSATRRESSLPRISGPDFESLLAHIRAVSDSAS